MAQCLKYVATKAPAVTGLAIRTSHISTSVEHYAKLCNSVVLESDRAKLSAHSVSADQGVKQNAVGSQEKILSPKSDSAGAMKCSSFLIVNSEDNHSLQRRSLSWTCLYGTHVLGVLHKISLHAFKQRDVCDLISTSLIQKKSGQQNFVLPFSSPKDESIDSNTSNQNDPFNPPSEEQLRLVHQTLANDLPSFFKKPLDLSIYHPHIFLEDNIRGRQFRGHQNYHLQSRLLYIFGHIRFMYVKLDVLKVTSHPEDGTVKVRWRISVFRLRSILHLKLFNFSRSFQDALEPWVDGFSTYFVMGDGLVHRHVVDRMIPDPDQLVKTSKAPKPVPVPNPLAYSDKNKL